MRFHRPSAAALLGLAAFFFVTAVPQVTRAQDRGENSGAPPKQIHSLKITVLSTMLVGDTEGVGEWGFSALVEADGHRISSTPGLVRTPCCRMRAS